MVDSVTLNQRVVGSSPTAPTILFHRSRSFEHMATWTNALSADVVLHEDGSRFAAQGAPPRTNFFDIA